MSKPEHSIKSESTEARAFARLEAAVAETMDRMNLLREKLREAEVEGRRMKEFLDKFTGDNEDATSLTVRLQELESANRDLLERLSKGRAGVERLLARIRYLEEQA